MIEWREDHEGSIVKWGYVNGKHEFTLVVRGTYRDPARGPFLYGWRLKQFEHPPGWPKDSRFLATVFEAKPSEAPWTTEAGLELCKAKAEEIEDDKLRR